MTEAHSRHDHADAPSAAPDAGTSQTPHIQMETSDGPLVFELWSDVAPRHVENFRQLVREGFYDGLTFHRVIPSFIVQGGCPHGDGTGTPGYTIDAEFNDRPHERGTLSMARTANPNSAGSQFFICLARENCAHLDGEYTAFGRVVHGHETLDRLASTHLEFPELGTPSHPPQIMHCYELWDWHSPEPSQASPEDAAPNSPVDGNRPPGHV